MVSIACFSFSFLSLFFFFFLLFCFFVPLSLPLHPSSLHSLRVHYGAGRGRFSLARPLPYNGLGVYFRGDPCAAPVLDESPLMPWMWPPFSLPGLAGTCLVNGQGRGQGQATLQKHTLPWAVQCGGAGNCGEGPHFYMMQRPRNKHYIHLYWHSHTPPTTLNQDCLLTTLYMFKLW